MPKHPEKDKVHQVIWEIRDSIKDFKKIALRIAQATLSKTVTTRIVLNAMEDKL